MKPGDRVQILPADWPNVASTFPWKMATLMVDVPGGWIVCIDKVSDSQPVIKAQYLKVIK